MKKVKLKIQSKLKNKLRVKKEKFKWVVIKEEKLRKLQFKWVKDQKEDHIKINKLLIKVLSLKINNKYNK